MSSEPKKVPLYREAFKKDQKKKGKAHQTLTKKEYRPQRKFIKHRSHSGIPTITQLPKVSSLYKRYREHVGAGGLVNQTQEVERKKVIGLFSTPGRDFAVKEQVLREIEKSVAGQVRRKGVECAHNSQTSARKKVVALVKVELKKRGLTPPESTNYYNNRLSTTFLEETTEKLLKNKNASSRTKKRKQLKNKKNWHTEVNKRRKTAKEVEL